MYLAELFLKDFRNVHDARIAFGSKFNLLIGENAQGKTNIVEAVELLASGRSFRTHDASDFVRHGAPTARAEAVLEGAAGSDVLAVHIEGGRRTFLKNGKRTVPRGLKSLRAIVFAPEEILLLRGTPGARRAHLDAFVGQLAPGHTATVRRYEKILVQRNRLLQREDLSEAARRRAIAPWDDQLVEEGARLMQSRFAWIERINALLPEQYAAIAPHDAPAFFRYRPHCGGTLFPDDLAAIRESVREMLDRRRGDEFIRRVTLVGPHRDDLEATIGDGGVRHFASQGQHRTFVLALKIAEMELLRQGTEEPPLLILDDVASELDDARNRAFFDYLRRTPGQVFITATDEGSVRLPAGVDATRFDVRSGSCIPRK